MNDDHQTGADPGAPYRHPELSPTPTRSVPRVDPDLDRITTSQQVHQGDTFLLYLKVMGNHPGGLRRTRGLLPAHLHEYRERAERGEV